MGSRATTCSAGLRAADPQGRRIREGEAKTGALSFSSVTKTLRAETLGAVRRRLALAGRLQWLHEQQQSGSGLPDPGLAGRLSAPVRASRRSAGTGGSCAAGGSAHRCWGQGHCGRTRGKVYKVAPGSGSLLGAPAPAGRARRPRARAVLVLDAHLHSQQPRARASGPRRAP